MTTIQEFDIQMRRTGQCFFVMCTECSAGCAAGHLRIAESFRLVRESSATEKISPASSLYENRKLPVRQTGIPPLKGSLFVRTESRRIGQRGRLRPAIRSGNAEFGGFVFLVSIHLGYSGRWGSFFSPVTL